MPDFTWWKKNLIWKLNLQAWTEQTGVYFQFLNALNFYSPFFAFSEWVRLIVSLPSLDLRCIHKNMISHKAWKNTPTQSIHVIFFSSLFFIFRAAMPAYQQYAIYGAHCFLRHVKIAPWKRVKMYTNKIGLKFLKKSSSSQTST